jgi:hypothetical protein
MRILRVVATVLILVQGLGAQQPAFDAASVKRRTDPGGGFLGRRPGGRFVAEGASLQELIEFAYGLQPYQITGGPGWLSTAVGCQRAGTTAMLRRCSGADRSFSLVVRRDAGAQVYALVLARRDAISVPDDGRRRLRGAAGEALRTGVVPAEAGGAAGAGRVGSIQIGGSPLSGSCCYSRHVCSGWSSIASLWPWDVTLTYTPEPSQIARGVLAPGDQPNVTPDGPSIFTAVQEQLGLKLESTRAPVDVLVIDRAEFARDN